MATFNVKQPKAADVVTFSVEEQNGEINLFAEYGDGDMDIVLTINQDGTLYRHECVVAPGLQTGKEGRIKLARSA